MERSFVLLTAIPPTVGHLRLVQFADSLTPNGTVVLICTQPHEPFAFERVAALREAVEAMPKVTIQHFHKSIEQDPSAPGFWNMWKRLLLQHGVTRRDYIVASETYGQKVAELIGAQFFPYDIDRSITHIKATPVRQDPLAHFSDVLPEFQRYIQTRVTVFGAESTGKTTLSRRLAEELHATWLFEYARPYLENTVNEITTRSMTAIWKGQKALQEQVQHLPGAPIIIQDTDLFSTVGYWQFPHWTPVIGTCPDELLRDALSLKSDLYIFTKSNIPFEADPLRYGGNKREGSDEYWLDVCKRYELPYVVLGAKGLESRVKEAKKHIMKAARSKTAKLVYDRHGY